MPQLRRRLRGKRTAVRTAPKGLDSSERLGRRNWAIPILARLRHHCEIVSVNGNSCRLKNRLRDIGRNTDVT